MSFGRHAHSTFGQHLSGMRDSGQRPTSDSGTQLLSFNEGGFNDYQPMLCMRHNIG